MLPLLPQARFRIYTTFYSYTQGIRALIGGSVHSQDLANLQEALKKRFSTRYAILVPQCRVGIYLTFKHLIKPGQKVLMSPYTIVDISNMVLLAGGLPDYVDVELGTCNISADEVEERIGPDTGAVLITHLHGLAAEADRIRAACDRYNVPLIEDCAQAFGTVWRDKPVGTFGKAGIFSFGMYKNVNAWTGGAIITDDAELAQKINKELAQFTGSPRSMLRKKLQAGILSDILTHPIIFKLFTFWIFRFAFLNDIEFINKKVRIELDASRRLEFPDYYRFPFTAPQARLVLRQLDRVDSFSTNRMKKGLLYHEGLNDIKEIIIPPARSDLSHTYTYFPIQYHDRNTLIKFLMKHCRDLAAQHYKNNADLEEFKDFFQDCPAARSVASQLIFLPTYPTYSVRQVERNIRLIRRFFGKD
ncbi:MAG: DegT/DnrJ/EryC1/StrS aminotransferase family protein [Spirochaetales bacterium]|nr:DegT/DnrJ/EryC1/StrS aminotransferase family protein [Spirochaetales bacterium]